MFPLLFLQDLDMKNIDNDEIISVSFCGLLDYYGALSSAVGLWCEFIP